MSGSVVRGRVVSCKMQKTISVLVQRWVKHSLYAKYICRSKKYQVRDDKSLASIGDIVEIIETRPISKTVSFRLKAIVRATSSSLPGREIA